MWVFLTLEFSSKIANRPLKYEVAICIWHNRVCTNYRLDFRTVIVFWYFCFFIFSFFFYFLQHDEISLFTEKKSWWTRIHFFFLLIISVLNLYLFYLFSTIFQLYRGRKQSTLRKPQTYCKYTSPPAQFELTTLMVIGTDCTCSCTCSCIYFIYIYTLFIKYISITSSNPIYTYK